MEQAEGHIFGNISATCIESTKRGILRYLASIYDPLGIASPITLVGKVIYRQVCEIKAGWDQKLTDDLYNGWKRWLTHLPARLEVPRPVPSFKEDIREIILHGFADASSKGTSAAIYAVVIQKSGISQGLLCSKSRLLKKNLTILRLELVSAHMAANLLKNVRQALSRFPVIKEIAWSDSTTALHWIKGAGQYKEFVRNRVAKIKENKDICWRYVDTIHNPADIGSRGCLGDKLNHVWLEGPPWLRDEGKWPIDITTKATKETEEESRKIKEIMATTTTCSDKLWNLLSKFSFWKAMRITSWVLRFVYNSRTKKSKRTKGPLISEEIDSAKLIWIKQIKNSNNF